MLCLFETGQEQRRLAPRLTKVALWAAQDAPWQPSSPNISCRGCGKPGQAYHTHETDLSPESGGIKDSNPYVGLPQKQTLSQATE